MTLGTYSVLLGLANGAAALLTGSPWNAVIALAACAAPFVTIKRRQR